MAACRVYAPKRRDRSALSVSEMPSAIWSRFHNERSCCSSRIKSPSLDVLAARRDSCSNMSPNRPINLGFREQAEQKSAQTDRLTAEFGACLSAENPSLKIKYTTRR